MSKLSRRQLFKRTAQVTAAAVVAPMVVVEALSQTAYTAGKWAGRRGTLGVVIPFETDSTYGKGEGLPLFNTAHPMAKSEWRCLDSEGNTHESLGALFRAGKIPFGV